MKYSTKKQTFGDRFLALKGEDSFITLSEKMKKKGIDISPAALHKWTAGGGINSDMLVAVADYFGVSAAELFFGEVPPTPKDELPDEAHLIGWCWNCIPERFRDAFRGDILKLARAYAPKDDVMVRRLDAAISRLKA